MPRLFSISKFDRIIGKWFGSAFCRKFEKIFNELRNRLITLETTDRLIVLAKK
jgi:hypothetical protein